MSKSPDMSTHQKDRPEPSSSRLIGSHWGFYEHRGTPETLRPFSKDDDPAAFAAGMTGDRLAPCRILKPAVRRSFLEHGPGTAKGRRGAEPFVEVSWDEALDLVASEIARVRDTHGSKAIFSGCYGWSSAGRFHHAQSQLKRFFNMVGGSVRSVQTYSYAAGEVVLPHVIGTTESMTTGHTPWSLIAGHAELIVMFGGTPLRNAQVNSGGIAHHTARSALLACRDAGARLVNVTPVRDDTADELGAEWLALRPCTDTALLLALAHTLIATERYDKAFVDRYTVGFDQVRAYLTGETDGIVKDATWASAITGLDADAIRDLAADMSSRKTFLMMSWSLQRADHGEQPYWALVALAALLGGIGLPGEGFGFGYASVGSIGQPSSPVRWPSLPQGRNPEREIIPVARIADMLLSPGCEYEYNGAKRIYPDIKFIYWAGGNPFHHHQDLNRLTDAWQRPETVVVHEHWWNPLARHADIVLPASTFLERDDVVASGRDSFIAYSSRVAEAPQQVPTDHEILRRLSARLGAEEAFTEGLSEAQWLERLYGEARNDAAGRGIELPDVADFRAAGLIDLVERATSRPFLAPFRADPQAHPLRTPSGRIELFSERIASYGYDDCPGHAAWLEPAEWLGAKSAQRFPLHLLSCQPHDKLHSQWDHAAPSRKTKHGGRQPVRMHPRDAAARGLAEGDLVKVSNDRGACLAIAALTEAVMPGVVQLATGAWFDPWKSGTPEAIELNGNPNVLTPDHGTSRLSQGPSPNACLVEITRYAGEAPQVRAYQPPEFVADGRKTITKGNKNEFAA
ncbi:MAG: biotin transporter BioY [Rhizobiales bacterium 62-17]|nr:molybdopterin-dependent oxidoreductase [Hyphomicrobiales bacterium]OJY00699.1 MAG: biotin transporter BioY [Rhizobiales bacterium 62-17]